MLIRMNYVALHPLFRMLSNSANARFPVQSRTSRRLVPSNLDDVTTRLNDHSLAAAAHAQEPSIRDRHVGMWPASSQKWR